MTVHEVCHQPKDDDESCTLSSHLLRCDSASSISYVYHKPVSSFSLMFVRLENNLQDKSSANSSLFTISFLPSSIRSSHSAPLRLHLPSRQLHSHRLHLCSRRRRRHRRRLFVVFIIISGLGNCVPSLPHVRVQFAAVHSQPQGVRALSECSFEEDCAQNASEGKGGRALEDGLVEGSLNRHL